MTSQPDALKDLPEDAESDPVAEPGPLPRSPWHWQEEALLVAQGLFWVLFFVGNLLLGAWLDRHFWVIKIALIIGCGLLAAWGFRRNRRKEWEGNVRRHGLRYSISQIDRFHFHAFEFAVRDLMRRDGFRAERIGGSGDDACDVRAVDPDGRIWAVQVKHRRDGAAGKKIGTPVLQQVKGTAQPVHGATFALVVTNGGFSAKAVPWGKAHDVHLVDRELLETWAAGSGLLWNLIEDVPAPKRHPSDADHKKARRR
ncbi:restriction endonuclease [Kitasatospora sp. NPDC058478]|uniref:restriction endonuclease n=1 Tax=unclassified Kitasatospora TaxID=2633591 RepID=UPI00365DD720